MSPDFSAISRLVLENHNLPAKEVASKVIEEYPNLSYIDHGLERIVFIVENSSYNDVVLKIARNERGIEANKQEYKNWNQLKNTKYSEWLCPVDLEKSKKKYIFMDKVQMSAGNYEPVMDNLIEIISAAEISSHNVGYHRDYGDVLIDYTYKI